MKLTALLLAALGLCSASSLLFFEAAAADGPPPAENGEPLANPRIDYAAFQRLVIESAEVREANRLTEGAFIEMMREPGVVVLDARSAARYRMLHITGAVNVPFTEFTAEVLAAAIPRLDTPVLIYCNNNFEDRLDAFPTKIAPVSLNVSTYTSLRAYGYTRVYELGPLLRVATSRLPFTLGKSEAISFFADGTGERAVMLPSAGQVGVVSDLGVSTLGVP